MPSDVERSVYAAVRHAHAIRITPMAEDILCLVDEDLNSCAERWTRSELYRPVDRALQKLRKSGKIRYLRKSDGGPGWTPTPSEPAR